MTDQGTPQNHEDHEHTELEGILMDRLHTAHDRLLMLETSDYILREALKMLMADGQKLIVALPEGQKQLVKDDGSEMNSVTLVRNGKVLDLLE